MPQPNIKMSIEFISDESGLGRVNVTGPLENDILCFGLLEKAKQTIIDHNKVLQERQSVTGVSKPGGSSIVGGGINPNSTWRPPSS